MIIRKKEDKEEDWEFDFSIYEKEDKDQESIFSVKKDKKPRVTFFRSRFSPSSFELENLSQIKLKISEFSIRVASQTQDINDLWKLYGCLNEYWARIHDIFGKQIIDEINEIKDICVKQLRKYNKENNIPYELHDYLLYFRDKLYMLSQRVNLSIEVERSNNSFYKKAKDSIVQ